MPRSVGAADDRSPPGFDHFRVRYDSDVCIVRLNGEIDNDVIFGLCDEVDLAIDYYNYKTIQIEIDSSGGSTLALEYYLTKLDEWHRKKIIINTRGLTRATSAASYILTLGAPSRRHVYPSTRIAFHYSYTEFSNPQRKVDLEDSALRLDTIDKRFIDRTINSVIDAIHALGTVTRYPLEPSYPSAAKQVSEDWAKIGLRTYVIEPTDNATITTAVHANIYRLHEYGEAITPDVAASLLLIDHIIRFDDVIGSHRT